MTIREQFVIPARYNLWSLVLMGVGVLSILILFFTHNGNEHERARFWASLLQNSVYFLLVTNACMFFLCATTLAWGGWQVSFRRVTEAISTVVPVLGVISVIVLMVLVFGGDHVIYHWTDSHHVEQDAI